MKTLCKIAIALSIAQTFAFAAIASEPLPINSTLSVYDGEAEMQQFVTSRSFPLGRVADCLSSNSAQDVRFFMDFDGIAEVHRLGHDDPQKQLDLIAAVMSCSPFESDSVTNQKFSLPALESEPRLSAAQTKFLALHPEIKAKDVLLIPAPSPDLAVRYPNTVKISDVFDAQNIRAIPKTLLLEASSTDKKLDISKVNEILSHGYFFQWSQFYKKHKTATRQELLEQCQKLDLAYHHMFVAHNQIIAETNARDELLHPRHEPLVAVRAWARNASFTEVVDTAWSDCDANEYEAVKVELSEVIERNSHKDELMSACGANQPALDLYAAHLLLSLANLETGAYETAAREANAALALKQTPSNFS